MSIPDRIPASKQMTGIDHYYCDEGGPVIELQRVFRSGQPYIALTGRYIEEESSVVQKLQELAGAFGKMPEDVLVVKKSGISGSYGENGANEGRVLVPTGDIKLTAMLLSNEKLIHPALEELIREREEKATQGKDALEDDIRDIARQMRQAPEGFMSAISTPRNTRDAAQVRLLADHIEERAKDFAKAFRGEENSNDNAVEALSVMEDRLVRNHIISNRVTVTFVGDDMEKRAEKEKTREDGVLDAVFTKLQNRSSSFKTEVSLSA